MGRQVNGLASALRDAGRARRTALALTSHFRLFLRSDSSRWQATSGVMLSGDRNGSQYFGSLAVSGVFQLDRLNLAPYLRADRVLNGYAETGSATAVLSYGAVSVSENSAAVGLYAG